MYDQSLRSNFFKSVKMTQTLPDILLKNSWDVSDYLMLRDPQTFGTKVLNEYLRKSAMVSNIKRGFEHSIEEGLIKNILPLHRMLKGTSTPERVYMVVDASRPVSLVKVREDQAMTPGTAIRGKTTYQIRIWGWWVRERLGGDGAWQRLEGDELKRGRSKGLLSIPLMLDTKWCWLYGKQSTAEGRRMILEDGLKDDDPFGWFIIEGRRRVFKSQEKLMFDSINVSYFIGNKQLACQATTKTNTGTHRMRVQYNSESSRRMLCNEIGANLTGMFKHTFNVYRMYRLLMWPGADSSLTEEKKQEQLTIYNLKPTDVWMNEFDAYVKTMLTKPQPRFMKKSMKILNVTRYVFKALDRLSDEQYLEFILAERNTSAFPSVKRTDEDKKQFSKKIAFDRINDKFCRNIDEIFLQPGILPYTVVRGIKVSFLAQMVARFIEVIAKVSLPDDRDRWIVKHVDTAGRLIEHNISVALDTKINFLDINKKNPLASVLNDVNNMLHGGFNTNNWGVKGMYSIKTGVVFDLLHETIPLTWSEVVQIRPPIQTKKTQVNSNIRGVQLDQVGFIDPLFSPEDDQAGLVKSPCMSTETTFEQSFPIVYFYAKFILDYVNDIKNKDEIAQIGPRLYVPRDYEKPAAGIKVFVDQYFLGMCTQIDAFYYYMRKARNEGTINAHHTTLHLPPTPDGYYYLLQPHYVNFAWRRNNSEFYIYRNIGRLTRPLLIVRRIGDDVTLPLLDKVAEMNKEEKGKGDAFLKSPITDLIKQGYMEFLDCNEQDSIAYLADSVQRIDQLRIARQMAADNLIKAGDNVSAAEKKRLVELKRRADRDLLDLTNCEIDSQNILGLASGLNPLTNFAPAPRGTFQSKIGSHALGCLPDIQTLFEPMNKVLFFPMRPIAQTFLNDFMRLDKYPVGQVCWVAFMALDSNQEDGIVGKKSAFANGLFSYLKVTTVPVDIHPNQRTRRPAAPQEDITHLDSEGIVSPGEWIEEGQILANIAVEYKGPLGETITQDVPTRMAAYSRGYVLEVKKIGVSGRPSQIKILMVVLRKYGAGSKLVARFSQKGMLCEDVKDEDLPQFIVDGQTITPSLVINPHSIPSRMTVGFLLEGILTMAGVLTGKRVDMTSFRAIDIKAALQVLKDNDYPVDMRFTAINPRTKTAYENKIFMVPIYYQALPHHYADEVQYRGPGGRRKMDTRQPVGHRGTLGASAQRFGEMEVGAGYSHAAVNFVRDRTCVASDAEPLVICSSCGAVIDEKLVRAGPGVIKRDLVCTQPECKGAVPVVAPDVPFVLQTWAQYLNALGIDVRYSTAPKQTGFFPENREINSN